MLYSVLAQMFFVSVAGYDPALAPWHARMIAKALSQPTIILDPGHGGSDAGAVVKGHREKEINLSMALRIRRTLKDIGGPRVLMTRQTDDYVPLDARVAKGSGLKSAIFVSIHVNDSDNRKDRGIIVYSFGHSVKAPKSKHRPVPPLPSPPDEQSLASAILASSVARSLRSQGFAVDGVIHSDYYVLKNPYHASVLVEVGFLTNPKDYRRLTSQDYRQKLAEALACSLNGYMVRQQRKKPPKKS